MDLRITAILPVFNAAETLLTAVESCLNDLAANDSLLVLDDGSNDRSVSTLDRVHDPRLSVVRRENRGLGKTLAELVSRAGTPIIARMDADDVWVEGRAALQRNALRDCPDLCLVGGQVLHIVDDVVVRQTRLPLDHQAIVERLLDGRSGLVHPAITFRAETASRIGSYRIAGVGEDIDFCLRMAECGGVANVPEVVLKYRFSAKSLSMNRREEVLMGYRYASSCAMARQKNVPEPEWRKFVDTWAHRPVINRVVDALELSAMEHYRLGTISRGRSEWLKGWGRTGMAALNHVAAKVAKCASDHV